MWFSRNDKPCIGRGVTNDRGQCYVSDCPNCHAPNSTPIREKFDQLMKKCKQNPTQTTLLKDHFNQLYGACIIVDDIAPTASALFSNNELHDQFGKGRHYSISTQIPEPRNVPRGFSVRNRCDGGRCLRSCWNCDDNEFVACEPAVSGSYIRQQVDNTPRFNSSTMETPCPNVDIYPPKIPTNKIHARRKRRRAAKELHKV
jgi:hypothetical protein